LTIDAAISARLLGIQSRGSPSWDRLPERDQCASQEASWNYLSYMWTMARIAEMVEREFGVRYHPDHIGRLMHSLGWTPQKPERRALERDEDQIERWKQREWPRIKKTPQGWAPISSLPMNRASC